MHALTDLFAIGKIVKAFGIQGDVIVQPMTGAPARFRTLKRVLLGASSLAAQEKRIEYASVGPRGVRLRLEGVTDRTAAEELTGLFLFVDVQHRLRPTKGSYFVHDIVGMTVLDQDGVVRGVITEVMKLPAQDVYVINNGARSFMIPAVKEFILSVDVAHRRMRVKLIDGMMEET
jgi:16S rRNA processing protein RimM